MLFRDQRTLIESRNNAGRNGPYVTSEHVDSSRGRDSGNGKAPVDEWDRRTWSGRFLESNGDRNTRAGSEGQSLKAFASLKTKFSRSSHRGRIYRTLCFSTHWIYCNVGRVRGCWGFIKHYASIYSGIHPSGLRRNERTTTGSTIRFGIPPPPAAKQVKANYFFLPELPSAAFFASAMRNSVFTSIPTRFLIISGLLPAACFARMIAAASSFWR